MRRRVVKIFASKIYVYHQCRIVNLKPDKRIGTFFDLLGTYPFAILITFAFLPKY